MAQWGYSKHNGPDTWPEHFPKAGGQKQSPIDIQPSKAEFDNSLKDKPLQLSYHPKDAGKLTNTGKSVSLAYDPKDTSLSGGPLEHLYRLVQFHFHWGKTSDRGSEHTVDGHKYAAEAHLVHYNTNKYKSFAEAAKSDHGLCVLGSFIKVGAEHAELKKITDHIADVQYSNQTASIGEFDPASLLPVDKTKYWTYPGSLTTPTCDESVTWIVFKDPIEVSEAQLAALRKMNSHSKDAKVEAEDEQGGHIYDNYRPPLELHGRTLRTSSH